MAKKKKIREDFEIVFKSGNEREIKKMLDKNPWLLDEVSSQFDETMGIQEQIIAALGVMEDELGNSVPIDEISFCLKVDFDVNGWGLTPSGGKVCDDFLVKNMKKFDF
ncbi:MAG: hypothetical protein ACTSPN_06795 [Promethearchaeota archaeon]